MECIRCHGFSSSRVCHSCSQRLDAVDYALAELQKAELAMLKKELGEAWAAYHEERDRLDWLESELAREGADRPLSLFRRNVPITRQAIDEAMAADCSPPQRSE